MNEQFRRNLRFSSMLVLGAALFTAGGCATPEKRLSRAELVNSLPAPHMQEIKEGRVQPGFDMDDVRLALGRPDQVTMRPIGKRGSREVWTYRIYADASGSPLYRGYYHRYFTQGDPKYPFYLDNPDRHPEGTVQVVFDGTRVIEVAGYEQIPVKTVASDNN